LISFFVPFHLAFLAYHSMLHKVRHVFRLGASIADLQAIRMSSFVMTVHADPVFALDKGGRNRLLTDSTDALTVLAFIALLSMHLIHTRLALLIILVELISTLQLSADGASLRSQRQLVQSRRQLFHFSVEFTFVVSHYTISSCL
jgi:hypothetical protein